MTIREELKKLVTKLGGTPSKEDQTAELIHKVTDNVSGGGSAGLVINGVSEGTRVTLDKTWQEIYEAFSAGQPCVILWEDQSTNESAVAIVSVYKYGSEDFRVCYASSSGVNELLYCTSADGYPAASFD